MDTTKELLLEQTYDKFIDIALCDAPLEEWKYIIDDKIMAYGTAADEKLSSVQDTLELIMNQREQVKTLDDIKYVIKPVLKRIFNNESSALIVDEIDLTTVINGENNVLPIRISTVLEYIDSRWFIIHWHGSIAEHVSEGEDPWHVNEWKQKAAELEKLVEEKTNDLLLKNRELEIEASLERVRAIALSMNDPADMLDVCRVISDQLKQLNVKDIRNIQTVIINESKGTYLNYQYFTAYSQSVTEETESDKHPIVLEMVKALRKSADSFFTGVLKGEKLDTFREYRKRDNQFPDPVLDKVNSAYYYFYSIGHGGLGITTYRQLSKEGLDIFKRFHNVFKLAYRRFMDIEKAEAQAREAQIEVSLERVRAMAMAMHSSEDLSSTVGIFFKELRGLGIIPIRCGVGQIDEATRTTSLTTTTSSQLGDSFKVIGKVRQTAHPVLDGIFENWKLQKEYHPVLKGDALKAYYTVLNRQINYPEYREDVTQYGNHFYFKEGFVFAWTESKLSEEELKIFRRFTSVLSLTYRRYLDLKDAEAQAREGQIEAALERIRSQATAMKESSDLLDIVVTMNAEFNALGHEAHYFWHMRWLPDTYEKAMTSGDGSRIGMVMQLPRGFHENAAMLKWEKNKEPVLVVTFDVDGAIDYVDKMIRMGRFSDIDHNAPGPDDLRAMGGLTFVMARTTHGEIGYSLPGIVANPPAEDLDTLVRFAGVFDLAYRRFEDLKSAERQNRESHIELALERVRARTMAMQTSEELAETASLLFKQFNELVGLPDGSRTFISIIDKSSATAKVWMTLPDGKVRPGNHEVPLTQNDGLERVFQAWQKKEPLIIRDLEGKKLADYIQFLSTLAHVPSDSGLNKMVKNKPTRLVSRKRLTPMGLLE